MSKRWYSWKWRRLAFAPTFWEKAIGDMDGEWVYLAMGFFVLLVDLRYQEKLY